MNDNKSMYERWNKLKRLCRDDLTQIDKTDLRRKDFNLADTNGKWLVILQDWKEIYLRLELKKDKIYRELYEWYRDEYNHRLDRKEDLSLFIRSDSRYISVYESTQIAKAVITFCEDISDRLKQKQWEIKAFIDYSKFMEGQV